MLAASSDGCIHITFFDVCFIIFVVFEIQWTELSFVESHLLLRVLPSFVIWVVLIVANDQRRIIKQSVWWIDEWEELRSIDSTHRNVVTFSSSPSSMCECFSTKKFSGRSTARAKDCSKTVASRLNSVASSAICSLNPGRGCKVQRSHVTEPQINLNTNLLHPGTSSWVYRSYTRVGCPSSCHQSILDPALRNRCCQSHFSSNTALSSARAACKNHLSANKLLSTKNEIRVLTCERFWATSEICAMYEPFHRKCRDSQAEPCLWFGGLWQAAQQLDWQQTWRDSLRCLSWTSD